GAWAGRPPAPAPDRVGRPSDPGCCPRPVSEQTGGAGRAVRAGPPSADRRGAPPARGATSRPALGGDRGRPGSAGGTRPAETEPGGQAGAAPTPRRGTPRRLGLAGPAPAGLMSIRPRFTDRLLGPNEQVANGLLVRGSERGRSF